MRRLLAGSLLFGLATACIRDLFHETAGFDSRPLAIQTLSLFNQRPANRLGKKSWKGDWIFRRDRLDLIDLELRNRKPDILFLQQVMDKLGSAVESDRAILGAGVLSDYEWRQQKVEEYGDSDEAESLAIAVSSPAKFLLLHPEQKETWMLGLKGYASAQTLEFEDQPLTLFNVQMPAKDNGSSIWYSFLQERIAEKIKHDHLCAKRLIVAGFLPGDEKSRQMSTFLQKLQLKDVATGFCQLANNCYTATPTNELFVATVGDEAPSRTDKILLHRSAYVYASARSFEEADPSSRYAREFGLTRLWPTERFGWFAQVRLSRCLDAELGKFP